MVRAHGGPGEGTAHQPGVSGAHGGAGGTRSGRGRIRSGRRVGFKRGSAYCQFGASFRVEDASGPPFADGGIALEIAVGNRQVRARSRNQTALHARIRAFEGIFLKLAVCYAYLAVGGSRGIRHFKLRARRVARGHAAVHGHIARRIHGNDCFVGLVSACGDDIARIFVELRIFNYDARRADIFVRIRRGKRGACGSDA